MIRMYTYGEVSNKEIFERESPTANVSDAVRDILAQVRQNGDAALRSYTKQFDGVELQEIEVSASEMKQALQTVSAEFLEVLRTAAGNIRAFHEKQLREGFSFRTPSGAVLGQKITPIERVGLYVPGGTAAYPSTVLMDSIPAKIAGCPELYMVTPPQKDGSVNPSILAAASIAGVDRIFKVGGAQAIAALAYGTESLPKADKIVGPGNAFVAEAKKQVFGAVSIDMIAGPSEILVVADESNDPAVIAADLLSQAEHDRNASAVLVTDSRAFAEQVGAELEKQIPLLPRAEIARASIDRNGKIIIAQNDLPLAIDIANEIAPEHLELCVDDPFAYLDRIRNAGSVFLGKHCPEALGDYLAGPNHTLPTGGTARFSSPLSVDDFVKKTQYLSYTEDALREVAGQVAYFAGQEGLEGHAKSVLSRFAEREDS